MNHVHSSSPGTTGGVVPSLMSVWLDGLTLSLEAHRVRLYTATGTFQQHLSQHSAYTTFASTGDLTLLNYATRHTHVSLEEIAEQAKAAWEKTMEQLGFIFKERVRPFTQTMFEGATKLDTNLEGLTKAAKVIKSEPNEDTFKLSGFGKYAIDGNVAFQDVQPLWNLVHNLLDFRDRMLLPYIELITRIINNVDFTKPLDELESYDLSKLDPKSWFKGAAKVEGDDRFKTEAVVYRSNPAQGNRALYAAGPVISKDENSQNWKYVVRALRAPLIKYYPVPTLKDVGDSDGIFDVSPIADITRRLDQLSSLTQSFLDQKGPTDKLVAVAQRLEQAAQRLWNKASQFKEPDPAPPKPGEDPHVAQEASVSKGPNMVLHDVAMLINNVIRLVTDFFDILSIYLLTTGGLAYATMVELKAYDKPNEKLNSGEPQ